MNDTGVVFLFEVQVIAAQHPALQVTLINSQDESVTLCFDSDTHLPVKKSFSGRDPVDKQKNLEEGAYENCSQVPDVLAPSTLTPYFMRAMARQSSPTSTTLTHT